jgi:hypothetical protein
VESLVQIQAMMRWRNEDYFVIDDGASNPTRPIKI